MKAKLIAQLYQKFPGLKGSNVDQKTVLKMAQSYNEWEKVKDHTGTDQVYDYMQAIEAAPVGIYQLDFNQNKIIFVNQIVLDFLGYTREEMLSLDPMTIIAEEYRSLFLKRIQDVFQSNKSFDRVELGIITKNGSRLWADLEVRFLRDNRGNIYAGNVAAIDITERYEMGKVIENSLNEKEVLLREVHHRVKNNLAIINSLINLQIENNTSQDPLQVLRDANSRIMALATIHTKIYESEELNNISLDGYLNEIIDTVLENYVTYEYDLLLNRRISSVKIAIDDAVPFALIINEILTNAIRHAFPDKKGKISINIHANQKGQVDLIQVKDNGIGIDSKSNNGFGNLLINQLAQQVDMEAELVSEANKGTTWTLRSTDTIGTIEPEYVIGHNTVYIVEDESIIAMDMKNKLEKMGLEVIKISARGEETIEDIVKMEIKPALIMMDINLKGDKNGIETAAALKQYGIPVIFRSGYSTRQIKNEINDLGMERFDIIGKSIQEQKLKEIVFKYLGDD